MQQKSTDELHGIKCHLLFLVLIAAIKVGKCYFPFMDRNDPVVGNGNPVGVAAEICQHLVRCGKRPLGKNDPFFTADLEQ